VCILELREIIETLKSFQLSDYESRTYANLVLMGPAKASIISRQSNIPRSKIYEVLNNLVDKSLVEVMGGRPVEFKAVTPEVALKNLLEKRETEILEQKRKIETLSNFLKPVSKEKEVMEGVWTSKEGGWKDFVNRVTEMFDRSNEYIYVITRDFTWSSKQAESLKKCVSRGVKIRTVAMKIDDSNYYRAKWYHSNGVEIRLFKTDVHPRLILIDGKEVLMRLDRNPIKRESFSFTSIWSRDPALVKALDVYAKSLWNMAKAVDFSKIKIRPKNKELVFESE